MIAKRAPTRVATVIAWVLYLLNVDVSSATLALAATSAALTSYFTYLASASSLSLNAVTLAIALASLSLY